MSELVNSFRNLHTKTTPLILPNAWDAGSARLVESLGAAAVATTSAGVAWSLGYRDGRIMPVAEVLSAASRIVRVISVPLTIDFEHGYSDDPKIVAENVLRLIDLGVAGINLEDGGDDPLVLARKISAIKHAASNAGADIFINARSDVFLASLVEKPFLIEESIKRGSLYAGAGADGLFLPVLSQAEQITAVVSEIDIPLNVMALPGLLSADALGKLGVRRLSAGSGIAQAALGRVQSLSRDFLLTGLSAPLMESAAPYAHLQKLFPMN